jgi:hypothetical protein
MFAFVSFLLTGFPGTTCGQIPRARPEGPGLALALGMYMKRRSLTFVLWLVAASVPGSLHAQAVNPTTAQFGASADHNATAADGTPAVTRYDLDFYFVGALQPFQVVSLGKPTPDANNNISVNLAALLGGSVPSPGIVYESRVLAIGPGGSGVSTVSNTFEYAVPCSFGVSPTGTVIGSSGGAASVTVTTATGCGWTAVSNAPNWLTVTSGASGSGTATASYTVAVNTLTPSRFGTLTVAGQSVTVTQNGAACSFTVSPTSPSIGRSGGASSVTVTTTSGCAWTATSNASWLTVTSGASGSGSATVSYAAAANTATPTRTGTLTVAGQTVTVTETASLGGPLATPGNVHIMVGR